MYVRLYDKIWTDKELKPMEDHQKLAFVYLMSCKHHNMIGFYHLPLAYMQSDLGWQKEKAEAALKTLEDSGFIGVSSEYVLINSFLKHNPIGNPNQAKGAIKAFSDIDAEELYPDFLMAVLEHDVGHSQALVQAIQEKLQITKLTPEAEEVESKKTTKPAKRARLKAAIDYDKEIPALLQGFGEAANSLQVFIDLMANHNQTGTVSASRVYSVLTELRDLNLPNYSIMQGAKAAIKADVSNHKYLIKVAKNQKNERQSNEPAKSKKYGGLVEQ